VHVYSSRGTQASVWKFNFYEITSIVTRAAGLQCTGKWLNMWSPPLWLELQDYSALVNASICIWHIEQENPDTILKILKEVYGSSSSFVSLHRQFFDRKQKDGESLKEFSHSLWALIG